MYFQYGAHETEYLKSRDKALGEVIDGSDPSFGKPIRIFSPLWSITLWDSRSQPRPRPPSGQG